MGAGLSLDARTLAKRALWALSIHLALLALWPGVRFVYAPAFRSLNQFVLGFLDPLPGAVAIRFTPGAGGILAEDLPQMDTVVGLLPKGITGEPATFGASSFFQGYFPSTVLFALFAASYGLWRERRHVLWWAAALLHLGIVLRFVLPLYYCYAQCTIDGRSPLGLGPTGMHNLHLFKHFVWEEVLPNYLGPLLVYALCVFGARSRDAARS